MSRIETAQSFSQFRYLANSQPHTIMEVTYVNAVAK